MSALESQEVITQRLSEMDTRFNLSEVKGPGMDRLKRSDFLEMRTGSGYLSQYDAFRATGAAACTPKAA